MTIKLAITTKPASVEDIASRSNIAKVTAYRHLKALVASGVVVVSKGDAGKRGPKPTYYARPRGK